MIAVSGFSRSGTTILQDVLNTHPQVKILYEASLLVRLPATRSDYISSLTIKDQNESDIKKLVLRLWKFHGDMTYDTVDKLMQEVFGVPHVGDKLSSYFQLFSAHGAAGIRRIYIYRDARDACASYWKCTKNQWQYLPWAQVSSVREVAERWVASISAAEKSSGVHCVRYEELILRPDDTMRAVADFLQISPKFDTTIVHDKAEGRGSLTTAQLQEVEDVAGPTLRRLGY